jgi:hypothetical protein
LIRVVESNNKSNNLDEWRVEKGSVLGTYLINFKKQRAGVFDQEV